MNPDLLFRTLRMSAEPAPEDDGGAGGAPDILPGTEAPPEPKEEPTGVVEEGWLQGVPVEFAQDSSLQNIKDMPSLVKSYVNAQKLIGKNKVVIPDEHATDEDRREFLHKIGLPSTLEDYSVERAEESVVSEDIAKDFIAKAYENGILPNQAKAMLDWYESKTVESQESAVTEMKQQVEQTVSNLQAKYGTAYETKIGLANKVLMDTQDPETIEAMRAAGLLNNQHFIETLVSIADKATKEGSLHYEPKADGRLTPSEAQEKINMIMSDGEHPYHNKQHPNHGNAVKEMTGLFNMV